MPDDLHKQLEMAAIANSRSLNNEIVYRLVSGKPFNDQFSSQTSQQPLISAQKASALSQNNKQHGLANFLLAELSRLIQLACSIGVTLVEFNIAHLCQSLNVTEDMICGSIRSVSGTLAQNGYVVCLVDNNIIVSF